MQHTRKHIARTLGYAAWAWVASNTAAQATVASIICDIYNGQIVGGFGPGIATMAVIALGISAVVGKVSWGMTIAVGIGIMILFSASTIVSAFGLTAC